LNVDLLFISLDKHDDLTVCAHASEDKLSDARKLVSADACGDTGKATKYRDMASDKEDGMQLPMYINV